MHRRITNSTRFDRQSQKLMWRVEWHFVPEDTPAGAHCMAMPSGAPAEPDGASEALQSEGEAADAAGAAPQDLQASGEAGAEPADATAVNMGGAVAGGACTNGAAAGGHPSNAAAASEDVSVAGNSAGDTATPRAAAGADVAATAAPAGASAASPHAATESLPPAAATDVAAAHVASAASTAAAAAAAAPAAGEQRANTALPASPPELQRTDERVPEDSALLPALAAHLAFAPGTAARTFALRAFADVGVDALRVFMRKEDQPVGGSHNDKRRGQQVVCGRRGGGKTTLGRA
eukprot:351274-Chlamydomonas_euryale.AAC.2